MTKSLSPALLAAVCACLAAVAPAPAAEATTTPTAVAKLKVTMTSALEDSPALSESIASGRAEIAEMRAATAPATPSLSWQREGIGSGFEREINAADYLRLTVPFNPPWQRSSNQEHSQTLERYLEGAEAAGRLEVAALAGRRWLELAAEVERSGLAEARVTHLETTFAIQTRRLELGEISGSEHRQLELELATERAGLRRARLRSRAAAQRLEEVVPAGFPEPTAGDLAVLVASTSFAISEVGALEAILSEAPLLRDAELRQHVASSNLARSRRAAWGHPELDLEWERIPGLAGAAAIHAAGFRIGVPLQLGGRGRQAIRAAEARSDEAAARRARRQRELRARASEALAAVASAQSTLEAVRGVAAEAPTAEHSLAEQFRLGAISYVVYLDGVLRLDNLRQTVVEAQLSLLTARLELARISGRDSFFPIPFSQAEDSQ